MKLTIAIPTYLREQVLLDTCAQVLAQMDPECMELILIDQTPDHDPQTDQQLGDYAAAGRLRWIRQQPPSLTQARNRALHEAKGEQVLFLDDDILLSANLFRHHLRWFDRPDIAAVTGESYNCRNPDRPPPLTNPEQETYRHCGGDQAGPAQTTVGNNHSVRRAIALEIGGYDPAFVGSALMEDMDFCRRLARAGHAIWYDPEAWIIHLAVKSGGCAVGGPQKLWPEWQHTGNFMLYAFRHGRSQGNFRSMVWQALRHGPLRKENARNPIRWPAAWWGFLRGCLYGWRRRG